MKYHDSILTKTVKSFHAAYEIAVRNVLPSVGKVFKVYNLFNNRLYKDYIKKGGETKDNLLNLEERAFDLTERYFDIQRAKELSKLQPK
jgi:hypothetical protein